MALYHYAALTDTVNAEGRTSRYFSGSIETEVIASHEQYAEVATRIASDNGLLPGQQCAILSLSRLD